MLEVRDTDAVVAIFAQRLRSTQNTGCFSAFHLGTVSQLKAGDYWIYIDADPCSVYKAIGDGYKFTGSYAVECEYHCRLEDLTNPFIQYQFTYKDAYHTVCELVTAHGLHVVGVVGPSFTEDHALKVARRNAAKLLMSDVVIEHTDQEAMCS